MEPKRTIYIFMVETEQCWLNLMRVTFKESCCWFQLSSVKCCPYRQRRMRRQARMKQIFLHTCVQVQGIIYDDVLLIQALLWCAESTQLILPRIQWVSLNLISSSVFELIFNHFCSLSLGSRFCLWRSQVCLFYQCETVLFSSKQHGTSFHIL